jgi:hypothetical protein
VAKFFYLFLVAVFYTYGYLDGFVHSCYSYLDGSADSYIYLLSVVPVKVYVNTDLNKLDILKENKGKSGVYR